MYVSYCSCSLPGIPTRAVVSYAAESIYVQCIWTGSNIHNVSRSLLSEDPQKSVNWIFGDKTVRKRRMV